MSSVAVGRRALRLDDGDDQPDGAADPADPDALGLGCDLHHALAGVVYLPRDLPRLFLGARDRLDQLAHDLLERVAVAVVEDRHPRRRQLGVGGVALADLGRLRLAREPRPRARRADQTRPSPRVAWVRLGTSTVRT